MSKNDDLLTMGDPRNPRSARGNSKLVEAPSGGGERNRTDDLLLAKQALSQLSYTPETIFPGVDPDRRSRCRTRAWWARVDLNYRPHAYQACALTN